MNFNPLLHPYTKGFQITGNLESDIRDFLIRNHHEHTFQHVIKVAAKASELAGKFNANMQKCEQAGWLHDISAVIPDEKRLEVSRALGIEILPEEETTPMILHQKLSVPIAKGVFGVDDPAVLSAIGCHTTLKAQASIIDKIVFVSDKITWDQEGVPPYFDDLLQGLEVSIDAAALAYLNYLWGKREALAVLHPWAVEAREDLLRLQG
jgi:predicted HD superfamily hydrolase involved in NAD metabolism